jgi:uridine monophosphate synthetase
MENIILKLYNIGCIKFGNFILKNKSKSNIYIDLRVLISYPKLLLQITDKFKHIINSKNKIDLICGVPYGGLHLATCISTSIHLPMIFKRKEIKTHGLKKEIEGIYKQYNKCAIVDDVLSTGSSILETIKPLQKKDIHISYILVICNRSNLDELEEIPIISLFTIKQILDTLLKNKKININ